jgi:hypothetical protein
MRWAFAICVTIAAALTPSLSIASPSAKLVYVRSAGAEVCPDEAELRRAVATRIGYDPFFPVAQKTVVAQVSKAPQGYRAHVQIVAEDGTVRGERDLGTKGQDCGELVGAIALAISVALDDLDEAPAPPPDPPPPPARAEPDALPAPREPVRDTPPAKPDPAPAKPPEERVDLAGLIGGGVVTGTAPSIAASGQIAGILGMGPLALRIDGRADAPSGTGLRPNGRLSTTSFVGVASVCVRGKIPFFCAGAGPGWISSTTEGLANPRTDGAAIFVAALRFGARIRASRVFFVEPSIVAGGNLVRHDVVVDGQIAYELPFLWGGASILAGFDFL